MHGTTIERVFLFFLGEQGRVLEAGLQAEDPVSQLIVDAARHRGVCDHCFNVCMRDSLNELSSPGTYGYEQAAAR